MRIQFEIISRLRLKRTYCSFFPPRATRVTFRQLSIYFFFFFFFYRTTDRGGRTAIESILHKLLLEKHCGRNSDLPCKVSNRTFLCAHLPLSTYVEYACKRVVERVGDVCTGMTKSGKSEPYISVPARLVLVRLVVQSVSFYKTCFLSSGDFSQIVCAVSFPNVPTRTTRFRNPFRSAGKTRAI